MAPRDDDKAMDGLLRRSLARDAAAGDTCPEPDILAAYIERSLDDDEMARHELHFSQCAKCREQLSAMLRAGIVMENPAEQELMDVAPTGEAPRVMAARSIAGPHGPKRPVQSEKFNWRWLAPVAAAALLLVFIYGRNLFRSGKPMSSENQVAMSKPEAAPPAPSIDEQQAIGNAAPAPPSPAQAEALPNHAVIGQPKPPFGARALPHAAKNSPSARPPREDEAARQRAQRSQYEISHNLLKRSESPTGTATSLDAPAEADSLSVEKKNSDVAPAPSLPGAAAPPAAGISSQSKAKPGSRSVGRFASSVPPKSAASSVAPSKMQKQAAAGANAGADARGMTEALVKQPAWLVIPSPDVEVEYRVRNMGLIERTDDGGTNWRAQWVDAGAEILAGVAPSANVCWLVGRGGIVLMTNDGENWKQIPSVASVDLVQVTATDASYATVTAADGRKFSTQNGGATWQLLK